MPKKNYSYEENINKNHKEYENYMNEKVDVCIPLGGERKGTTTTASCDGKIYEIELGKVVSIPRKVAEIIERSIIANNEVQEKIDKISSGTVLIGEY